MRKRYSFGVLIALLGLAIGLYPQNKTYATVPKTNTLINFNSSNTQGSSYNTTSQWPSVTKDGSLVAFASISSDLVPGDTNNRIDIFVRNTITNTTQRVSVDSSGAQLIYNSYYPYISSNGKYVVYSTDEVYAGEKTYIHNMSTGTTTLVSGAGNSQTEPGGVSDDGRFVAFWSNNPALNSSASTVAQVYVKDMVKNTVSLISQSTSGGVGNSDNGTSEKAVSMSCDGRFVAFESSASNLVSGDTNASNDIFLADRVGGDLTDLTINGNASSGQLNISCDGNYIGFTSYASNLVSGDTNSAMDGFVYDRLENSITRDSVDSSGNQSSAATSFISVSDGGKFSAFISPATDLVSTSTGGHIQAYLHDRTAGTTELLSQDSSGNAGDNDSLRVTLSANGSNAFYSSRAQNLVTTWAPSQWNYFESATGQSVCSI